MRRTLLALALGLVAGPVLLHASQIAPLSSFSNGTTADAAIVNANFAAVRTAANETDTRLTTLQTAPTWTAPTFQNGWTNYDTTYQLAGYQKDAWGRVYLKGLVRSGTVGSCIFTLPDGFRPPRRTLHAVQTHNDTIGRLDVLPTGCVTPVTASNLWVSLDDISFSVN